MNKNKLLIFVILGILIFGAAAVYLLVINKKAPLTAPSLPLPSTKEVKPSDTLTEYSDPSGFTFSYPDNLSISKKDPEDESTYADIQIFSQDISGSLSLKITDSKFKILAEWLKANTDKPENAKEVQLGSIKASEIKLSDRVLLGALDQGILFTVQMPLMEEKFWMPVYGKIISNFAFAAPEVASIGNAVAADDVVFEGEEVVE